MSMDILLIVVMVVEVIVILTSLQILHKKEDYDSIKSMLIKIIIITVGVVLMYVTKYLIVGTQGTILDDIFGSITLFDLLVGVLSVVITLDIFKIGLDIQETEQKRKIDDELKYIVNGYKSLLEEIDILNKYIETIVLFEYREGTKYNYYDVGLLKMGLDSIYTQIQGLSGFVLGGKETNLSSDLIDLITDVWSVTTDYQKVMVRYLKSEAREHETKKIEIAYDKFYEWVTNKDDDKPREVPQQTGRNFYKDLYKVNKRLSHIIIHYLKEIEKTRVGGSYKEENKIKEELKDLKEYISRYLGTHAIVKHSLVDVVYPNGEHELVNLDVGETHIITYSGVRHNRKELINLIHEHSETYNVSIKSIEIVTDYKNRYNEFETLVVVYEKVKARIYKRGVLITINGVNKEVEISQIQNAEYYLYNLNQWLIIVNNIEEMDINVGDIVRVKSKDIIYYTKSSGRDVIHNYSMEEMLINKPFECIVSTEQNGVDYLILEVVIDD